MFRDVVNRHLNLMNKNSQDLAAAAEVAYLQMEKWLDSADQRRLDREAVNRISWSLAFLYDQQGNSSAIDHVDVLLGELLNAAGFSLYDIAA